MREFKYGDGVIASNFLLNLLLVKMSEKSLTKVDFRSKNQKDMSDDGTTFVTNTTRLHDFVTPSVYRTPDIQIQKSGFPDPDELGGL